jgi:hypothetical protein
MIYLALFVAMAVTAAVAFKLWSIMEARRRIERRTRRAEPILTEGTPRRPQASAGVPRVCGDEPATGTIVASNMVCYPSIRG